MSTSGIEMPAGFIGHGTPMNALADNTYTRTWSGLGGSVPTPLAVLVVSAHWYIDHTAVTAMARPRTIHDFYGFPDELFAVDYPAPGNPEVAELVAEATRPKFVGLDIDAWGLDHGTWSVLVHMFPEADVPVLQLSINGYKSLEHHLEMGTRLAALRQHDVLVLGSGNIVHNLRRIDPRAAGQGFDWAQRFDERARELLTTDPESVLSLVEHPDFAMAVPTPDHFIPMLYLAGMAAAAGEPCRALIDGYEFGSLSMTSYTVGHTGAEPTPAPTSGDRSEIAERPGLPDPSVVPPESTNL